MSFGPPAVVETAFMRFFVLNPDGSKVKFSSSIREVRPFLSGVLVSADKATLKFVDVVASRSLTIKRGEDVSHHHGIWDQYGPFTFDQIDKMIGYNLGISIDSWYKHMNACKTIEILYQ